MDNLPEEAVYEICIQGHLDSSRTRRFGCMVITHLPDGTTALIGPVLDQAALYGLLSRIRDLGTPLLSLRRLPASNEQEFEGE